ncbi:MAG: BACON domain-containing protein [Tidjanibacter sp.]|nr:BACON domain-containing protein [Tidjanibacter sp.]
MNIKRLLLFLAAPLALLMNSCVPNGPEYTLPEISVTTEDGVALTSINFPEEGGEQKFVIKATRSWNINSQADWFGITPLSYSNPDMVETVVQAIITAAPNDGEARNETIKISMDKTELSITVAQAGKGQVALGDVLYYDNFDKGGQAQKGSSGWDTYMDGDTGRAFCNPTPENQAGVSYTGTKLTVRSNSSNGSGGTHSNYEGSGVNYLWFGTAPTNFTISDISLAELEGNALTLSFGTERYEYNATDNTFNNNEFKVYISGDGEKWTELSYSFLEGVNLNGKWNIATSQFNLKEVPETISLYFTASVGAAYALDDVKLTAGGGGAEIDLSAGGAIEGGNTGGDNTGGGTTEPDPNAQAISVAEFIEKADTATTYQLTGTISGSINTQYGNFDLVDESGSIYIYGLVDNTGATIDWAAKGLNAGDVITVQGKYFFYEQGNKHEIKNALYISHTDGEGGGTTEPEPPVAGNGEFVSDSPFVQAADNSTNAVYTLGNDSKVNGQTATGFKLGKSKQQGKFTSKAIGVSGDKYLNFYAVAWGAGGDQTIYFRVNGGEAIAQPIKANDGAAQNPPYTITVSDSDHYSILLSGLAATDVIEFSSNAAFDCAATSDYATRAIFFGVKLTDEANGEGGNTGGGTTEPDPEPDPTPDPTPGITNIADILAMGEGATISNATIEGVVISNMDLNNLTSKKGLYVQDATAGLQFYLAANHTFAFGDKVQIDLSGATVGTYNDAIQISGLALEKITKISSGNAVEAKTVSMADFLANKYEGQYVALEGVQVVAADLAKTWVMDGMHTSIGIEDANGNNFVVFSSKYATYGSATVAQGSGTIKGIAGYNKGTVQIIFGQNSDYAGLTGARFGEQGEGGGTTEPEPDPDKPELGEWAGRDDFATVAHNSSYTDRTTTAGWVGKFCAVQSGGPNDANPVLPSLLGSDPNTRAFCIAGGTDKIGSITSPVLNGGIGKLKFTYGLAFTDKNGVDIDVTIMQNGEAVKTINVKTSCAKYEVQSFEEEINIAGDFQIVFTNNCPSQLAGNKDRVSIWDVMWTAAQ